MTIRSKLNARTLLAVALTGLGLAAASAYAVPEHGTSGGVGYQVGGVDAEEARQLSQAAREYPVELIFAWKGSGEYLADVQLSVRDESGRTLLSLNDAGPIVLLKLAPGRYRVDALRNTRELHRMVQVGANTHQQAVFYWPKDEADAPGLPVTPGMEMGAAPRSPDAQAAARKILATGARSGR